MLTIKALHLIFMVTWFAGLFYLPRLFVYHAQATDKTSIDRFKIMERKLFFGITTPGCILTLIFGFWLLSYFDADYLKAATWLHMKLTIIAVLVLYHLYCGYLYFKFKADKNNHSHVFYRFLNEVPV
ncbi:MAG: CopD family protein, partial [Francisellaceae bacterium]|nr:CopD family protein [Francisellaceae bacterium]